MLAINDSIPSLKIARLDAIYRTIWHGPQLCNCGLKSGRPSSRYTYKVGESVLHSKKWGPWPSRSPWNYYVRGGAVVAVLRYGRLTCDQKLTRWPA